jgi:hypothetical protein
MFDFKACTRCNQNKSFNLFNKNNANKDGLAYWCKECYSDYNKNRWQDENLKEEARRNKLFKRYGITSSDYDKLFLEQEGKCKICGTDDPYHVSNNSKYFCVDHCHKTGNVRGLLCNDCNVGIGRLKDNIDILQNAIVYLKEDK